MFILLCIILGYSLPFGMKVLIGISVSNKVNTLATADTCVNA